MSTVPHRDRRPIKLEPQWKRPGFNGEGVPVTQSGDVQLGLLIGTAQHLNPQQDIKRFDLCILDLDAADTPLTAIPMRFFGHGVVPDPVHPERVSVFEKRGKGACEIDLKRGAVTRTIETAANREFYGHGAYSPDGSLLYCTETIVEGDFDGLIAVRDAETHRYLGEFPSYGASPHDCRLIDDGKTMVVANGGGAMDGAPPNVSYIDVASEKLIEKLEFDAQHVNAGHLDITDSGKLAVVSAQRQGLPDKAPGGISLATGNGTLHTLQEPQKLVERLYGESLSVCIHESGNVAGVTTPAGNLLTFWDLDSGALLHYYILQNPRGIELTQDKRHFAVSYGQGEPPEALCLIDADTLAHVRGYDLAQTWITGSHLTSYTLPPELRQ